MRPQKIANVSQTFLSQCFEDSPDSIVSKINQDQLLPLSTGGIDVRMCIREGSRISDPKHEVRATNKVVHDKRKKEKGDIEMEPERLKKKEKKMNEEKWGKKRWEKGKEKKAALARRLVLQERNRQAKRHYRDFCVEREQKETRDKQKEKEKKKEKKQKAHCAKMEKQAAESATRRVSFSATLFATHPEPH